MKVKAATLVLLGCAACGVAETPPTDQVPGGGGKADGIGPGSSTAVTFVSRAQKGGFWELANGDIFSSFHGSSESLTYGRTRYHFETGLIEPGDAEQDDVELLGKAAGSCVDDGQNYECLGGILSPWAQESGLASNDDRMLWANSKRVGQDYVPTLTLTDPAGSPQQTLAEYPSLASTVSPKKFRLQRLPSGDILFAIGFEDGLTDRSVIVENDGTIVGEIDGFAMGHRNGPLEILVRRTLSYTEQEYRWWNPATAQTSLAANVPASASSVRPIAHRAIVTTTGGLALSAIAEDRVIRFSPSGALEADEVLTGASLISMTKTGAALVKRSVVIPEGWDWSVVLVKPDGTERTIYSRATLEMEAGWHLELGAFGNPHLDGIPDPVFDDAGTMYVPFVQSGNNSTTTTYVVGFTAAGDRLFGVELDTMYGRRCLPHSVLPSGRLAVACEQRVLNWLYLLGD